MKQLRPTTTVRRALVVLASFVLSLTALPGSALCMGSNGHLAIEAVGSECVSPADGAAAGFDDGALAASSLHGCIDTPLGAPSLRSPTDPSQAMHCAVARAVTGLVLDRRSAASTVAARPAPPVHSRGLSIVLLL
ncbi:MAG: hypothetical protein AB1689_15295 [Thermodesulfobacteriota bacterium]